MPTTKSCSGCNRHLPAEAFSHESGVGRLRSHCKVCRVEKTRWYDLQKKYGLSRGEFQSRVRAQGGVCPCCGVDLDAEAQFLPCVDHDHETDEVRGILCRNCNLGLGHAKDSTTILQSMIDYLEAHNERKTHG